MLMGRKLNYVLSFRPINQQLLRLCDGATR